MANTGLAGAGGLWELKLHPGPSPNLCAEPCSGNQPDVRALSGHLGEAIFYRNNSGSRWVVPGTPGPRDRARREHRGLAMSGR